MRIFRSWRLDTLPASPLGAEQGFLRVLSGNGYDWALQVRFRPPAPDEASVPEVAAAISFDSLHLRAVIRANRPLPVQPGLPPIWHRIGQFDRHDACPLPVTAPPRR